MKRLKNCSVKFLNLRKKIAQSAYVFYQVFLQPLFGFACCYYPSCSCYSKQAFQEYGFIKGLYFSIFRVLRCHPLSRGGFDPLPLPAEQHHE